jgi:hypothetical protein
VTLTFGFDVDPPDEVWTAVELEVGAAARRRDLADRLLLPRGCLLQLPPRIPVSERRRR